MSYEELNELIGPKEGQVVRIGVFAAGAIPGNQDSILESYKNALDNKLNELDDNLLNGIINPENITEVPENYEAKFEPFPIINIDKNGNINFRILYLSTHDGKMYDVKEYPFILPKYNLSSLYYPKAKFITLMNQE